MKKSVLIVGVLIILVAGFLVFYLLNQTTNYNLTEKFGVQGKVIDYGTYNEESYYSLMDKINKIYVDYSEEGKKVYFVFGNKDEVTLSAYEEINRGSVNLVTGKTSQQFGLEEEKYMSKKIIPENNKVNIIVNNQEYEFSLKTGESIFFIIVEEE